MPGQTKRARANLADYAPDPIPTDLATLEQERRIRVLTIVTLGLVAMMPFFVYQYIDLGVPSVSVAVVIIGIVGLLNLALARRRRDSRLGGWVATSILLLLLVFSNLQSGGFYDPNFGWLYVFPMLAALLVDVRAGWVFTILVLLLMMGFWLAPEYGFVIPDRIPADEHARQSLANRISAVLAIGIILAASARQQLFARELLVRSNQELQNEIEHRSQVQQQLIRTERAASMGKLIAGLAHEINNPLTYVIGNLELLEIAFDDASVTGSTAQPEESQRLVADALEGVGRVADLVRDLREFTHGDEQKFGPVSVAHAVKGASRLVANEMRHRAHLEIDCDDALHVLGNEGRLQQILVILLTNGAHAIKVGSAAENLVRVSARQINDEVLLEVSDTGSGIPSDVREQIFEPFFTTKEVGEGSGMGLFVTRNIVKSLGGRIKVDSTPGAGSTFSIFLPSCESSAEAIQSARRVEKTQVPDRTLQILAIDDEASVLTYLRRALAHHDLTTEVSPRAGLERILEGTYDVILCDLMMPEMSGMEIYYAVRRSQPELADRMLFMTGGLFVENAPDFLTSLSGRWIAKPLRIGDLEQLIQDRVRFVEGSA